MRQNTLSKGHSLTQSLQVGGSKLVCLGDAVFVAGDAGFGLVSKAALLVCHLALVSTVVHHLEKGLILETLLHKLRVGGLGRFQLLYDAIVNAFHFL